jgi:hypothetical protein
MLHAFKAKMSDKSDRETEPYRDHDPETNWVFFSLILNVIGYCLFFWGKYFVEEFTDKDSNSDKSPEHRNPVVAPTPAHPYQSRGFYGKNWP